MSEKKVPGNAKQHNQEDWKDMMQSMTQFVSASTNLINILNAKVDKITSKAYIEKVTSKESKVDSEMVKKMLTNDAQQTAPESPSKDMSLDAFTQPAIVEEEGEHSGKLGNVLENVLEMPEIPTESTPTVPEIIPLQLLYHESGSDGTEASDTQRMSVDLRKMPEIALYSSADVTRSASKTVHMRDEPKSVEPTEYEPKDVKDAPIDEKHESKMKEKASVVSESDREALKTKKAVSARKKKRCRCKKCGKPIKNVAPREITVDGIVADKTPADKVAVDETTANKLK